MSVTDDFFKNPHKYVESLEIVQATELLDCLNREIPSCIQAIGNLAQTRAGIDLLERKILELTHGQAEGASLLKSFGDWKRLTQNSVMKQVFRHYSVPVESLESARIKALLDTIILLDESKVVDEEMLDDEEVQSALYLVQSSLDSLDWTEHELGDEIEKCQRVLSRYLSSTPTSLAETIVSDTSTDASFVSERNYEGMSVDKQREAIIRDVENGELSKAYWPVEQGIISLEDLRGYIDDEAYAWMSMQASFDPAHAQLEEMALSSREGSKRGLGWGYKSANLTILSHQAQQISLQCQASRIAVPSFMPVGDFEMQRYIMKEYPEILEDWSRFVDSYSDKERAEFTAGSLTLKEESKEILAKIRKGVCDVFEKRGYDTPALRQWLALQHPEFVIVRSTGKEDSDTNSNAGGNASIPFIRPDPEAIAKAMGEVLSSYFGEKSILQRMAAGDTSLFDRELFLPVLIQEMVGEPVNRKAATLSEIPTSGVIFTISGADPSKSELSVGRGNNEGIVSSSVMTDHYILGADGFVTKAVKDKGTRVVARATEDGGFECHIVENEEALLRTAPALSEEVAVDLKRMADYFSLEIYGKGTAAKPLDMEFSVVTPAGSGDRPTIFLLQARPLVAVKKEEEPSYISHEALKGISSSKMASGKTLIDGGAYVRKTSASSMIVTETITEALAQFLKSPPSIQSHIKTVVISKMAPLTSHEAVTLRARGIGILVMEEGKDYGKVSRWHLEGKPMTIDMQRGLVVEGLSEEILAEGYTCYPIPLEYSITPSRELILLSQLSEMSPDEQRRLAPELKSYLKRKDTELKAFVTELSAGESLEKPSESTELDLWKETLKTMAFGSKEDMQKAAAMLLDRLSKLSSSSKLQALPRTRLELWVVLEEVKKIIEGPLLSSGEQEPASLQRLYPVRLLEACLFQKGDVLGGFSALRCLESIRDQKEIMSVTGTSLQDPLKAEHALLKAPLIRLSRNLLSPQTREVWEAAIAASAAVPDDLLARVNHGLLTLSKLEILTPWANTRFLELLKDQGIVHKADLTPAKVEALFRSIDTEFTEDENALEEALKAKEKMHVLSVQMGAWADPEHVRKQGRHLIESFQEEGFVLDAADPKALVRRYQKAQALGKMALLQSSLDKVRTYDHLIKTVKSSREYKSSVQQAKDFKRLLSQYYVMMEAVLAMSQSEGFFTDSPGASNVVAESGLSIQEYLDRIRYGYTQPHEDRIERDESSLGFVTVAEGSVDEEEAAALMLPSAYFNVASATLGSRSDYAYSATWPQSLEDFFTLAHQNMESCIAALKAKQAVALDLLPKALQEHTQAMLDSLHRSSVTSISIEDGVVQIAINVPLRQHAATLHLSYDLKKPQASSPVQIKMALFGKDENNRWEMMAAAAALVGDDLGVIQARKPEIYYHSASGVSLEFAVLGQTKEQQRATAQFLMQLNSLTMSASDSLQYLRAVKAFKIAMKPGEKVVIDPKCLSQGGFVLALEMAYQMIGDHEFEQAEAILDHIEQFLKTQPSLSSLEVLKGFFRTSTCQRLDESITELRDYMEKARREGISQTPWQSFVRELQKRVGKLPLHFLQAATAAQKASAEFTTEAVLDDPLNILYVAGALKRDKGYMKALMQHKPLFYMDAASSLQADVELALMYVRHPSAEFKRLPTTLIEHEEVLTALVESNGLQLAAIPSRAVKKEMVLKALSNNGLAIQFAGRWLSESECLETAVSQNGRALGLIPKELVTLKLCELALAETIHAYPFVIEPLCSNPEIAFKALEADISMVKYLPASLQNVDFVLRVIEKLGLDIEQMAIFFKGLPKELQNKPEVAEAALSRNGLLLSLLDQDKITADLAALAASQNIAAHHAIPEVLWGDEALAMVLVSKEGRLFLRLHESLTDKPKLAALAVAQDPSVLPFLSVALQKDKLVTGSSWAKVA
jgi:hypothetical protein